MKNKRQIQTDALQNHLDKKGYTHLNIEGDNKKRQTKTEYIYTGGGLKKVETHGNTAELYHN